MTYLQITLNVAPKNRSAAAEVYKKYKAPFLSDIPGAESKKLLIRNEDVQVVHGFDTVENAKGYLSSRLFNSDVVVALKLPRRKSRRSHLRNGGLRRSVIGDKNINIRRTI